MASNKDNPTNSPQIESPERPVESDIQHSPKPIERTLSSPSEAQLDPQPQRTGSQARAVIFLLLAGPASCGLTTVPDNPSYFALIVFAAAWLAVGLALLEKYKSARVITVVIFCLSFIPFFVTLSNLSQRQAFRPGASAQNVIFGTSFLLLIRGGATLVLCGLALWSLPARPNEARKADDHVDG